jgi:ABC-type Fe3+-hydroxamate transport system substrate-binding protein
VSQRARAERIVSLLPSATEMIYGLGLEARLVGVTHECDYPPAARALPVLVKPVLPLERLSQSEIDAAVTARLREGKSLYEIDEKLLADLAPDLILTQDLCQVCAPSGNELTHWWRRENNVDIQAEVVFKMRQSCSWNQSIQQLQAGALRRSK